MENWTLQIWFQVIYTNAIFCFIPYSGFPSQMLYFHIETE